MLILWKGIPLQVMQEFEEAVRRQKPILVFVGASSSEDRQQSLTDLLKSVKADQEGPVQTHVPFVRCFQHYRSLGGVGRSASVRDHRLQINGQLKYTITMTLTRQEMYELGTQIILAAKRQLYVVQQTPILLLGNWSACCTTPENMVRS